MHQKLDCYLMEYARCHLMDRGNWNDEDGCNLLASVQYYEATGESCYKDYVINFLHTYVRDDGSVSFFGQNPGIANLKISRALFFAYHETNEEKYRKAIEGKFKMLLASSRCKCGNFWYSSNHPNQIWLEGLYAVYPFYMAYERAFDSFSRLGDISEQFMNVRRYLFDPEKKVYAQAYDEAHQQSWSDPRTGRSSEFSVRAIGLCMMSLVDCIELCDEQLYEHYRLLIDLLREGVKGILSYQEPLSHLFYRLVDLPASADNSLDTFGSSMIAYAILKAVRLHVLDEKYLQIGLDIFESIVNHALLDGNGTVNMVPFLHIELQTDNNCLKCIPHEASADFCHDDKSAGFAFVMTAAEAAYLRR
ncbi:MAG: glycoside hydrolase family 88 protein [Clostridiales bacterium]|nr:glycoside hydrolase family 88 protein [Clostridiales bacterium]